MEFKTILVHTAYTIFFIALIVKDVLWLRTIITIAGLCWLTFGHVTNDLGIVIWNIVFTGINIYQIIGIIRERRPVELAPDLLEIYSDCFSNMKKRDFLNFWNFGREIQLENEMVCVQGEVPAELLYLKEGRAAVIRDQTPVTELKRLNFIAEMSFVTKKPASADVITTGIVMAWSREKLADLEKVNPKLITSLRVALGQDLSQKLITG